MLFCSYTILFCTFAIIIPYVRNNYTVRTGCMYATIILSESNNSAVTYVGNFLGNLPARRPIHPISQLKIPFLYLIHILLRLNSLFIQKISIPFNSQYHYCIYHNNFNKKKYSISTIYDL